MYDSIINELESLCDDNHINFKYYNDVQNEAISFRFEKNGKACRYRISYIDLEYEDHKTIMKEITYKIFEMFNCIINDKGCEKYAKINYRMGKIKE